MPAKIDVYGLALRMSAKMTSDVSKIVEVKGASAASSTSVSESDKMGGRVLSAPAAVPTSVVISGCRTLGGEDFRS